jgi:hypothetical protein
MIGAGLTLAIILAMGQLETAPVAVLSSQGVGTSDKGLLEFRQGERGTAAEERPGVFVLSDHRLGEIGEGAASADAVDGYREQRAGEIGAQPAAEEAVDGYREQRHGEINAADE